MVYTLMKDIYFGFAYNIPKRKTAIMQVFSELTEVCQTVRNQQLCQ